jgi:enterochelin esterase-like enzyme
LGLPTAGFVQQSIGKDLRLEFFLPPSYHNEPKKKFRVLFVNDGQDMEKARMKENLDSLYKADQIDEIVVVAIHTDKDRIQDYGTIASPDYKNRGSRARLYMNFVVDELIPHLKSNFHVDFENQKAGFMGFSLGALSAFDIAWANPQLFDCVGVFSGALWWRKRAYEDGYDDHNDRLLHTTVRNGAYKNGMRFWLEAGTKDEAEDRNKNGIIDAIDDTMDLIKELEDKGYQKNKDVFYLEIPDGEHNFDTWSVCLPEFLVWAYGKK